MKEKNNLITGQILIKNQRFIYLDYLRIICSFFVILIHISSPYYYKFNINSTKWKKAHFYKSLSNFCVPCFFMISGTLFFKKDLIIRIIKGHYHLWYLFTTIGLYIIIPLTKEIQCV